MSNKPENGSYRFVLAERCYMCGATEDQFKVLGVRKNGHQGFRPRRLRGVAVTIQRCRRCRLVFPNPMPIPASVEQHYDMDPSQFWGASYSIEVGDAFLNELEQYRELVQNTARDSIPRALDIGAGLGKCMHALTVAGFDVTGLEPSPAFASKAQELFGFGDKLVVTTVENAEFPESHFDLVTFGAVLEHVQDPGRALARSVRWLRPGGLLHAEVPSSGWLVARMGNVFYRVSGTDYVGNLSPMHPPFHLFEFSAEAFHRHGAANGYQVARILTFPCTTRFPALLDWPLRLAMAVTGTGMQLSVWLRRD